MNLLDKLPSFSSLFRQSPENPANSITGFLTDFFGAKNASGIFVTPKNAVTLPAIYSAVRLLADTISMLPLQVFEDKNGEKVLRKDHPIYNLIHTKPNEFMTSFQWRQAMVYHVALWGNHYSLIAERTGTVPTSLIPFHPKDVKVKLMDGKLWYILQTTEGEKVVDQSNMVHIKGLGDDGIVGKSIISIMKENIGLGLAEQTTAANFFGKGMKLDYAITGAGQLTEDGLKNLRETLRVYEGSKGERTFLPLDMGMSIETIGVPPEDAQFLENRKFSVTDIARFMRIPPPLIYDLERATFSNITELTLSFVKFSLTPWLVNMEMEFDDKLFKEAEKNKIHSEYNVDGLLRGDIKQRSESHKIGIQNGWLSINEVRRMENLNPIPGGDQHFIAANMMPIPGSETSRKLQKYLKEMNGEVPTEIKEELLKLL